MALAQTEQSKYQTVTLSPGQVVYIPTNAIIIAKTATGDADVSSECLDTNGQPLVCYAFASPVQNDTGGHTEPFQQNAVHYEGVLINGVKYLFITPLLWIDVFNNPDLLKTALQTMPSGSLMTDISISTVTNWTDYGAKTYIVFKTPSSIGNGMELLMNTVVFINEISPDVSVHYTIPVVLYSDFILSNSAVPSCS